MAIDGRPDQPDSSTLPRWRLESLFASGTDASFERFLSTLEKDAARFSTNTKGKAVKMPAAAFGEAIAAYEDICERMARIDAFMALTAATQESAAHSKNSDATAARLRSLSQQLMFFSQDINQMKETELLDKITAPGVAKYAPWIREIRARRDHQLDSDVEEYLHLKSTVAETAWGRLFDMTSDDLRVSVRGRDLTLPQAAYLSARSPDAALRREVYIELAAVLGSEGKTFALAFNTLADIKSVSDRWRAFDAPDTDRHLENQISPDTIKTMVKTVRDGNARTAHRYYNWKAKKAGVSRLHPADRLAPFPAETPKAIPFDDAKDMILAAFAAISPDMAAAGAKIFEEQRIDAEPRKGKQAGSFSHPAVPSSLPFILVNYTGTPRDVLTLAHEIGHGIHQMMAAGQGHFNSKIPQPLGEAASVFGEMLVFRMLLDKEDDLYKKRALLAARLEDMIDNSVGQVSRFTFEQKTHSERINKGELSHNRISEIWQEAQKECYGPAINFDVPGAENMWSRIADFIHKPFQSYTRPLGDGIAYALYDEYIKSHDREAFGRNMVELLSAGGTRRPRDAMAVFGFDLEEPAFWKKSLSVIERHIDELAALDLKIEQIHKSKSDFRQAANDTVQPPSLDSSDKPTPPKGPSNKNGGAA